MLFKRKDICSVLNAESIVCINCSNLHVRCNSCSNLHVRCNSLISGSERKSIPLSCPRSLTLNTAECYLHNSQGNGHQWVQIKSSDTILKEEVLFNDALYTFYLQLYCVGHMVNDLSNC